MKQVIGGKTYNTATADLVAEWRNRHDLGDFRYHEQLLYKTKKGTFFISGEDGAMSPRSQLFRGGARFGRGIKPLTEQAALIWCQRHNVEAQTIDAWFDIDEG